MRRLLLVSLLFAGCAWSQRPANPPAVVRALEIVGEVYGAPYLTRAYVLFLPADCETPTGPGYRTAIKGNCVRGTVPVGSCTQLNAVAGATLAESGLPEAAMDLVMCSRFGSPRAEDGQHAEDIRRAREALRAAGL